jgi:ArsR family transcriptional regulator, arsenate/arsenite/antimonite-responsive transcriptional repressor
LIQALKALADANRLKILGLLMNGNLCVGALAGHLGVSKPAVSQHLQILRKAGLVTGQKCGYWTHYEVDRRALARVAAALNALAAGENGRRATRETDMCKDECQRGIQIHERPEDCHADHPCRCHQHARPDSDRRGEHPAAD